MLAAVERDGPPELLVVTGPTACGKSTLAVTLAERLGGVVINADSMQVYRDLKILTARPDATLTARAPHRLYGILSGREVCSVGQWRALALAEIAQAQDAGLVPIVTGGTGLYLKALLEGLSALPDIPDAVRSAARDRMAKDGPAAFHAALAERDPEIADRLHPSDRQRLIRAWEVLEASGRSLLDWQRDADPEAPQFRALQIVLAPPRERLYQACDARFQVMLAEGALDEVRALLALAIPADRPVMKALGVPALVAHLEGGLDLEDAIALGQRATRQYAKRQMTWLRTQGALRSERDAGEGDQRKDPAKIVINEQYSEKIELEIFQKIRQTGLTA